MTIVPAKQGSGFLARVLLSLAGYALVATPLLVLVALSLRLTFVRVLPPYFSLMALTVFLVLSVSALRTTLGRDRRLPACYATIVALYLAVALGVGAYFAAKLGLLVLRFTPGSIVNGLVAITLVWLTAYRLAQRRSSKTPIS